MQCTFNHGGKCDTLGSREHYLVNNSTLVVYQDKPVSILQERRAQGRAFDHVLTVYNST